MITPTQAQIEAARLAMPAEAYLYVDEEDVARMLTAAAQVGEQGLSAAIGDNVYASNLAVKTIMKTERNATIERCAQVAEQYLKSKGYRGTNTAAAIRKLKEEA